MEGNRQERRQRRKKGGIKMGRGRERGREGRNEGERKKEGGRSGGSCGLHYFKGTVVQDFWSEFLHQTLPLGGPKEDSFEEI
jgi:hypothetical protein